MVCLSVADPDLQIRVHPDSEIRGGSRGWEGGGAFLKKFFSALLASVWSKNKGRLDSQAPPPGCATVYDCLMANKSNPVYTR